MRDLDMDLIKEVRDGWAFYRDRRPDAYDETRARLTVHWCQAPACNAHKEGPTWQRH